MLMLFTQLACWVKVLDVLSIMCVSYSYRELIVLVGPYNKLGCDNLANKTKLTSI